MERIYSNVDRTKLLHFYFRVDVYSKSMNLGREDLIDMDNFLQLSILNLQLGAKFAPHIHLDQESRSLKYKAQESWFIASGRVRVNYFDIDESFLDSVILDKHSVSVTLHGGHSYESLEDGTLVLEFKSGPYVGREVDKKEIKISGDFS
jgi:hypothetical protein